LEFIRFTFPAGALPRLPAFLVHRRAKPTSFTASILCYETLYGENQVFCCINCVFFMFFSCILNIFGYVVAFVKFSAAPCAFLRTKKMQDGDSSCIVVTK